MALVSPGRSRGGGVRSLMLSGFRSLTHIRGLVGGLCGAFAIRWWLGGWVWLVEFG